MDLFCGTEECDIALFCKSESQPGQFEWIAIPAASVCSRKAFTGALGEVFMNRAGNVDDSLSSFNTINWKEVAFGRSSYLEAIDSRDYCCSCCSRALRFRCDNDSIFHILQRAFHPRVHCQHSIGVEVYETTKRSQL
ncbi:hypothetical protein ZHAS_00018264 [Anopheles sinensis]|uniref:Uncharacterized protein n=1 Tax=Anopheles sinensis TaxID=74873 RepID=A0A084WJ04_ANOSI|nr:hypothetical protein ZHAS_00018264 [Anopheles sinensis]